MASKYVSPQYKANSFNCPHCDALAHQYWTTPANIRTVNSHSNNIFGPRFARLSVGNIAVSTCYSCKRSSAWVVTINGEVENGKLVYPGESAAPPPSDDMPEKIITEYNEARLIVGNSPRAAAAMLRLCLQKLMPVLGQNGEHLYSDIKALVDKGLPLEILQAMDSLRIFGNESIHPGTINLNEDPQTAYLLFDALNSIVDRMISEKREWLLFTI